MLAHTDEHVAKYLQAVEKVFKFIQVAQEEGRAENELIGPPSSSGFKRLV